MLNKEILKTSVWAFVVGKQNQAIIPHQESLPARIIEPRGPVSIEEMIAVELWRTVNLPINTLRIKENVGRVYLVEFAPHQYADPIVPIPLVDLGESYRRAAGRYMHHLLRWNRTVEQAKWSKIAQKRLKTVYGLIAHNNTLTGSEYQYLYLKLAHAAARPTG